MTTAVSFTLLAALEAALSWATLTPWLLGAYNDVPGLDTGAFLMFTGLGSGALAFFTLLAALLAALHTLSR